MVLEPSQRHGSPRSSTRSASDRLYLPHCLCPSLPVPLSLSVSVRLCLFLSVSACLTVSACLCLGNGYHCDEPGCYQLTSHLPAYDELCLARVASISRSVCVRLFPSLFSLPVSVCLTVSVCLCLSLSVSVCIVSQLRCRPFFRRNCGYRCASA